jgi:hypothetical protein
VWATAPVAETPPSGWWPHVKLTEHQSGLVEASIVGSRDPSSVDGASTLEYEWLVQIPPLVIDEENLGIDDPHQVYVHWAVGSPLYQLAKPALSALAWLHREIGIATLYQHSVDPRRGLLGKAAVSPAERQLVMNTEEGMVTTGPIEDQVIVMAGLRTALAYSTDTFDPNVHNHPPVGPG